MRRVVPAFFAGGFFGGPALHVYDALTGALLTSVDLPGDMAGSPATPVGKRVVIGSGSPLDGTGSAVNVYSVP